MKFHRVPRARARELSHPAPHGDTSPHAVAAATAVAVAPPRTAAQSRVDAPVTAPAVPEPPASAPSASATPASAPRRQPRFTPKPGTPPAAPGPAAPDATTPLAAQAPAKRVPATALKPVTSSLALRHAGRHQKTAVRAIIGDELRIPMLWCEFGSCINHYTDSGALGDRDLRHRALGSGWRYDALGRLACPSCVQHDATFWPTCPPALVISAAGG